MKDIKGYEGLYAITEEGKVWSYRRNKYLKSTEDTKGYLRVDLYKDKKRSNYKIHRLVAIAFIDNPDNKPIAHHKNHIKTENIRENLSWATYSENTTAYYDSIKQSQEQKEREVPTD